VRALPPGHVLEVHADGRAVGPPRRVLGLEDLLAGPEAATRTMRQGAVDEVERILAQAVAAHLVADVPLGVLLSGGVDSTVVASLATRAGVAPTFLTVGFDAPAFSEVAAARATAARLGGRHEVVSLAAGDVLALLPAALDAMDQPTADGMNSFVITRAAAVCGVKVLVSGLGGDEVFGGYTSFRKAPLLAAGAPWLTPLGRVLAALGRGNAAQWAKVASARGVRELREAYVLQRALACDVPVNDARHGLPAAAWDALATPGPLSDYRRVSYLELSFYLRNQLLRDADIFSSANSVELRVPFVDLEVLRLAWRLPAGWHLGRFGAGKRMLRTLLGRLEPAGRIRRAKMGFVFPWAEWLRGPLGERVAATLGDRDAHEALGIEPGGGRRLVDAFRRRDPRIGWAQLWSRFVLLEWNRRVRLECAPA
jgi:asparagine synthase (glutamine-hydrolysing)